MFNGIVYNQGLIKSIRKSAMVPSSFITSHITALGFKLASFEISTDASVCPALSNTPPFF